MNSGVLVEQEASALDVVKRVFRVPGPAAVGAGPAAAEQLADKVEE